ncbi:MAG TPA: hypothetical protein VFI92_03730 [Steroidobacteraceae bacterium]|nr:hypothetical protein [Steroidobacteraceae bacterium]
MARTATREPLTQTLVGGGIAATLDIVYAIVRQAGRGRSPEWTLQSVASGWLGEDAFTSGSAGAALGLLSHYAILMVAAGLFVLASRRWPPLRTHAALAGLSFGVLVYLFMNFVVLPLSAFPFDLTYTAERLIEGFVSHALLVGLPIALAARRLR